ncbi:MAG: hypothetical protein IJ424_05330 [Oscillospiraceae bacterium]|nr:hypothetical protein [Oscillospiraceae bacterium]
MNKSFLSNKWLGFGISLFNLLYLLLVGVLAIWTFLYEIEFENATTFNIVYITASVLFLALMIISRSQFITRIISMLLLMPVFMLVVFNEANPAIYLPPLIVGVIMFFVCTSSATTKVIMGTIYILMYFVGLVGFMLISTLFGGSAIETRLDASLTDTAIIEQYDMNKIDQLNANSVSPDGKYRYYILDVQDNERGKVIIVVEPNDMDIKYRYFTLVEVGYTSRIAKFATRGVTPDIEWISGNQIRYRFGEGAEWKTSTINIPTEKNYLRFLNIA